jgi:predicted lipoprotein with Yx(FWY)xxD motif
LTIPVPLRKKFHNEWNKVAAQAFTACTFGEFHPPSGSTTIRGDVMRTSHLSSFISPVLLAAALVSGCASTMSSSTASAPAKMENGVLVGQNGMTLYTFDKDADGKSMCNGKCAENWPPLMATGPVSGNYSVITRDDGSRQVAYKGKPLYYWNKDKNPGDMSGDGFNNVWHVAR